MKSIFCTYFFQKNFVLSKEKFCLFLWYRAGIYSPTTETSRTKRVKAGAETYCILPGANSPAWS